MVQRHRYAKITTRADTGITQAPSTTTMSTARGVGTGTTTNGENGNSGPNRMGRKAQHDRKMKERRQEMRGRYTERKKRPKRHQCLLGHW